MIKGWESYYKISPVIEGGFDYYKIIFVIQDTREKSSEKSPEKSSEKIILLLKNNNNLTISEISKYLKISKRAVEKNLKNLNEENLLRMF
jgi:ATP-dependent DNA helicase RecG